MQLVSSSSSHKLYVEMHIAWHFSERRIYTLLFIKTSLINEIKRVLFSLLHKKALEFLGTFDFID